MERLEASHSPIVDDTDRHTILTTLGSRPNSFGTLATGGRLEAQIGRRAPTTVDLIPNADSGTPPGGNVRVHFRIHEASFELEGACRASVDRWEMGPDVTVFSANRRRQPRLPVAGSTRFSGIGLASLPIGDAGPTGIQLKIPGQTDVRIGTYGYTEVSLGEHVFDGYARVRRRHWDSTHTSVGFEFEPSGSRDLYTRCLLEHAYPAMRPRRSFEKSEVLAMLDAAGYLKLTNGVVPKGWRDFSSPDSFDLVYRAADRTPIAHLSVTRAFETTWVYHQLAGVAGHPESFESRYAMYRLLSQIPMLMDGDRARAVAYFNPKLPWHGRYVYGFDRWMGSREDVDVGLVDRFHLDTAQPAVLAESGCSVGLMRPDEQRTCQEIVLSNWSPLVARAFDISPTTLRSRNLTPADSRLDRSREALVLRRGNEVIAVALAERGNPHMSLFGMFDIVHILPRTAAMRPSPSELAILVEHVRRWYAAQGVARPIVTTPVGAIGTGRHPAMTFVEEMGRFVLSARGLRHYENFLHFSFGEYGRAVANKNQGTKSCTKH